MLNILVVTDNYLSKQIWEESLKKELKKLYQQHNIRYIESKYDTSTSIQFSTEPYKGIREARGDPEQLKDEIGDTEVLIVHVSPVTSGVINAGENLKLICCARGGPVNIDVLAALKQGVTVTRTVGRNAQPVADHTMGLLLAEVRHIARAHAAVMDGSYFREKNLRKKWHHPVQEMEEKTLGLVGFGQVAREVSKRAQGFDLNLIAFDPYVTKEDMEKSGVKKVDLETLLKESDFVTVHARESPETYHLIGEKELALMKPNSYLINTSRGSLIDGVALKKALEEKVIAGASIDVFEDEPLKSDNIFLELNNITITPHTAGQSDTIPIRSTRLVAATLGRYLRGEKLSPAEVVDPKYFE